MGNRFLLATALGLLALMSAPAFAQVERCNNIQNLNEAKTCIQAAYKAADHTLNVAYKISRKAMDANQKILLRDAQRAWIKFRDAECEWEANIVSDGSNTELMKLGCLAKLTIHRTKTLVEEMDNAQRAADPLAYQDDDGAELLSFYSYGPILFGQTAASIEVELGEKIALTENGAEDMTVCYMARFPRFPEALLMVEKGIITRVEVDASVGNTLGVSVGDSFASVKKKFPHAEIELQKYVDNAHEITVNSNPTGFSILFSEEDGKITNVRAGTARSVQLVEHCL